MCYVTSVCFYYKKFAATNKRDIKKKMIRPDLWFVVTRVCFFEYTWPVGKKSFYHFEMERIALILIYNIFVTKKIFFRNEHQKKFLARTFLVDPVEWRQTNIFKSGLKKMFLDHFLLFLFMKVCISYVIVV